MTVSCRVHVDLRPDILDPQGKAILRALHMLGYDEVAGARVGRTITLELRGDRTALEPRVEAMAKALLANPVTENVRFEWPA